jgi:hypothetical protein
MHVLTKLAFYDELEKIAVSEYGAQNRDKLKRFMKSTVAIAAGAGVGSGLYMLGERAANKFGGTGTWKGLSLNSRKFVLGAASGAAGFGAAMAIRRLAEEKRKYER